MSKGFQSVSIVGVVGRDAESRSTPNGTKVVSFSVAVDSGFGDSAWTEWFNVVCFRDQATFVEKYVKKGASIHVVGKLKTRSWNDSKTNEKRFRTEMIGDSVGFFGGGNEKPSRSDTTPGAVPNKSERYSDPFAESDEEQF